MSAFTTPLLPSGSATRALPLVSSAVSTPDSAARAACGDLSDERRLTGTLPLRPFADRFFGEVAADLATTRVAALVCDAQGAVILLSLVGPDAACAAVLARLFAGQAVAYRSALPGVPSEAPEATDVAEAADVTDGADPLDGGDAGRGVTAEGAAASSYGEPWEGPTQLRRPPCPMKQFQSPLTGTRERHYLALAATADLRALAHVATQGSSQGTSTDPGAATPGDVGLTSTAPTHPAGGAARGSGGSGGIGSVGGTTGGARSAARDSRPDSRPDSRVARGTSAEPPLPQYVLGNAAEATPAYGLVLGHLRALRLPLVPIWTPTLWAQGQRQGLITPALALGVRAWRVETDRTRWNALLTEGVRAGWLAVPEFPDQAC